MFSRTNHGQDRLQTEIEELQAKMSERKAAREASEKVDIGLGDVDFAIDVQLAA